MSYSNPKGTTDYSFERLRKIQQIQNSIRKYCQLLNIYEIDTPILEHTDTLLSKYGKDTEDKMIFKLHNGKLALRYDMTVPLKRHFESNKLEKLKRLQFGKVFRLEQPEVKNGRFREFYQADVDIVGNDYNSKEIERSLMWLIHKVLYDLNITDYTIRYNYRQNLIEICKLIDIPNIPENQIRIKQICSTIDKLDKQPFETLISEFQSDGRDLSLTQIAKLKELLQSNYISSEVECLHSHLLDIPEMEFDATLARGLDYYSGLIFEVIVKDTPVKTIIAGGRYDGFINRGKDGKKTFDGIGLSFGISRMEMIMPIEELDIEEYKNTINIIIANNVDMTSKDEIIFWLIEKLRNLDYVVELGKVGDKVIKQIKRGLKERFNWTIIYGEDEDNFKLKNLHDKCFNDLIFSKFELIDFMKKLP